ncbi:serine hydrolase [Virgibacillus oceani]
MNMYAWIGLAGIIIFTGLPLLIRSQRTKYNINQFIIAVIIVFGIMFFTEIMNISYILAFIAGFILFILFDKKTYTKKRMIIYGSSIFAVIAIALIASYVFFKENPEYTLEHIKKNPENTSLYVSVNDKEMIAYQSNVVRPLASVVKIVIAVEYAYQIDHGDIQKDDMISLDHLDNYYIENTDGGAHETWLELLEEEGEIENNTVPLHDVAKGMITFSSNANTDYLIDLLGAGNINDRIAQLELQDHDDVLPIAGSLLAIDEVKQHNENDPQTELQNMPNEAYEALALQNSEKMKNNSISLEGAQDLSLNEQRIWSDRLPNAPAESYGKLLQMIANESFPTEVSMIMRDLMEWPMEMVEGNKEHYHYLGAKGGSTAFVFNQAMYVEDLDGNKVELVILMDDLSIWESLMLQNHTNSFITEMVNNGEFREKVRAELDG